MLTAIINDIIVPDIVSGELERETSLKNGDYSFLQNVIASGKVTVTSMTDAEWELFATLTSGPSSLDDGEAATIAVAKLRGFRAVIDEQKGRSRAVSLMDGVEPSWSLNLFRHPSVLELLGECRATDAVYLALRHGRMRIPAERGDEIVKLVGLERALECPCLPNFKSLLRGGALEVSLSTH